jgi:hypothetical protein
MCAASHAMELVSLKSSHRHDRFQINTIGDIPKMSLKNIRSCFNLLPETERNKLLSTKNKNGDFLAESLIFKVALLEEKGIRRHILTFMLDNDKKAAQLFDETPLWYAHQFYQNLHGSLQCSSVLQQHTGLLFRLPQKTRKLLIEIAWKQPIFIAEWVDNSTIFINNKQKKKLQCGNEEVKEKFSADTAIRLFKNKTAEEYNNKNLGLISVLAVSTLLPIAWVLNTIHQKWSLDRRRMALHNVMNDTDINSSAYRVLFKDCHVEYDKLVCQEETPILETIQSCAYFCAFSFIILTMLKIYFERSILNKCPIIKI